MHSFYTIVRSMFQVVRPSPSVSCRTELQQQGLWNLNSRKGNSFPNPTSSLSVTALNRCLFGIVAGGIAGMTAPGSRWEQQAGKVSALHLPWLKPGTIFKLNRPRTTKSQMASSEGVSTGPIWLLSTGRVSGHYKPEKLLFGPELGNPIFSVSSLQLLTSSTFLPASGMKCLENSEARGTWSLLSSHQVFRVFKFTKRTEG